MQEPSTQATRPKDTAPPTGHGRSNAQILELLRKRVLSWYYPPGFHLSEASLCAEFSASRIPIREALRALVEQKLVEKVPNQGCFVIQPDAKETQDFYDLRMALELFIVDSLATHSALDAKWVQEQRSFWEKWLQIQADETVDSEVLVEGDTNFHMGLAHSLNNQAITDSLHSLNERLRFVKISVITNAHRIQETAGEHLAILDAIENKDPQAARKSIRQNINHSRNRVENAIAKALVQSHQRGK
ncbi:MAG: GntR family transcriptional regulator [Opitutales bacterium]